MSLVKLDGQIKKELRITRFNKFLKRVDRKITVDDSFTYSCVGVRWYGEGAFVREKRLGMNIRRKQQWILKAGDVVYNKLFAWKKAFAIADKNVDGCIVSDKFPTYEIDTDIIEPLFLAYYFRTDELAQQAQDLSKGAAAISKLTLNPPQFWDLAIPLPPIEEQRRIVARVEELAGKIEEARSLRQQVLQAKLPNLRNALFSEVFQGKVLPQFPEDEPASVTLKKIQELKKKLITEKEIPKKQNIPPILPNEKPYKIPSSWEWVRLDDICLFITDGTHQTPTYIEQGMMFLSAQNIKPYRFMPEHHKCVSYEDYLEYTATKKAEKGDILITRVGAGIGETAMVDQDLDFAFYVSLGLLKTVQNYVHIPYLVHWLNSPEGAAKSRQNTLGRGHSQGNLNLNLIRKFVLPLPPLPEQRRIVAYLDNLQAKVDEMKRLREQALKELDAMLPSILDKAFKGEL